ncbi:hypothetical protein KEJ23_07590 [Candidatus Bathyarchaeota archaeon]|nr:hypothetical protein [Candidatus Bathyarchaeota archaeon]
MRLFRKRRESEVFIGGEEAPPAVSRKWHMRARIFMAATLAIITFFDWYIINHAFTRDPTLWYTLYSILLTIHIGWVLIAIAILSP